VAIEGAIALALSSTAVVVRVLRDLGRTLTQLGRVAIAILLVQDIAVGPLLVLAKALGGGMTVDAGFAVSHVGTVVAIAVGCCC
jgi:CPA2 family monovalent cation:H+ antiporter-2